MAENFKFTKDIVKGKRNKRNPVTLFIIEWKATNFFLQTNPKMILVILISAITLPHIHKKNGILITGNNLIKDISIKMKSAKVSSWLPNLVTLFVFLAIVPSIISVKPQKIYMI